MKNIFLIYVLLLFITSCSNDDIICDNSDCLTIALCEPNECFTVDDGTATQTYIVPDTTYSSPVFNPNDNNQYICQRAITHYDQPVPYSTYEIVKYSINEKDLDQIFYSHISIKLLAWNKNGKIYFSGGATSELRLKEMEADGSNITFITDENTWVDRLQWLGDNKIMIGYNDDDFIIDYQGNIIQDENIVIGVVSPNNAKILRVRDANSTSSVYLSIYDTLSKTWDDIFLVKEPMYGGLTWSLDGAYVYWTDKSGLNRIHLETRKAEMIRKNCNNDNFRIIKFDNQGNLYAARRIGKVVTQPTLNEFFESRNVRFDFNTCTLEDITPQ